MSDIPNLLKPSSKSLVPGLLLSISITAAAVVLQALEVALVGHPYLEDIVLAILIGTATRTVWTPGERFRPGIDFSGKILLEIAVGLLGLTISLQTLERLGFPLIIGIGCVIGASLLFSYFVCRALSLNIRMSILVAAGNSICGNSAIVAVAPVIGATSAEIASSIAFTAVLGVVVVLLLPTLVPLLGLSQSQYGAVAGLTVYAVPQVLAATLPIGATSSQVGTLVKLVRVLVLGPLVILLSAVSARLRKNDAQNEKLRLHQIIPWFILAFITLIAVRSTGAVPPQMVKGVTVVSKWLTILAMAALGLGVDLKTIATVGPRVIAAVTASLIALCAMSLLLIHEIHLL